MVFCLATVPLCVVGHFLALAGQTTKASHSVREERMGTQNISSLQLAPTAKKAAEALLKEFPDIVFTSGRRDLTDQARAMAGNVVSKRDWIKKTYLASDASKACQKWVDEHPEATSQKDIA